MEVENSNKKLSIVRFDGDELQVVGETREDGWMVLRPACEALGLDESAQRKRVQRSPWAVAAMMASTGPDGKKYEYFCVHLDTVPMWLATIDTHRVRSEVSQKLIRYQKEAAKVLAAHFLGSRPDGGEAVSVLDAKTEALVGAIADRIATPIVGKLESVEVRLSSLEERQSQSVANLFREQQERRTEQSFVPPWAARLIRQTITEHAKAITKEAIDPKAYRRQRGADELSLRIQFGFCGAGKRWEMFPVSEWPRMSNRLEELRRESGRLRCGTQLALTLTDVPATNPPGGPPTLLS